MGHPVLLVLMLKWHLLMLKWHLLQDKFSEIGLVLRVAEVEQRQEVVQGQEVHGVRFGGAECYPDDLKCKVQNCYDDW